MNKRALIIGIGGQDGSYLADILLEKGYEVHGVYRRVSNYNNLKRIDHIKDKVKLHRGDLTDTACTYRTIRQVEPQEIYNMADQDNVGWSHSIPGYTYDVTGAAVGRLLECIYRNTSLDTKFFQPVSATMFGDAPSPQDEDTRLNPQSPYACAKAFAYHLCRYYRQRYGMFVSTGIMYNHDSPRRTDNYLVHKICKSAIAIAMKGQKYLSLGNLDLQVDIGHAKEFMRGVCDIMQQDKSDDYVMATGRPLTIRELATGALDLVGVSTALIENKSYNHGTGQHILAGNITKAHTHFGFNPEWHGVKLLSRIIEEIWHDSGVRE